MKPFITVIIPTYKRNIFLERAVKSVLDQTYKNLEIIIIDDDPNSEIFNQISLLKNSSIHYVKNTKNIGASGSRNNGVKYSNGDFLAFLDDDDEWLPQKLEKQISMIMQSDDCGVIYCGYDLMVGNEILKRKNTYHKNNNFHEITLHKCPIGSPTPLIKKELFLQIGGYDVRLPSCQDWDLWIRLSKICKFVALNETLAIYRIHGNQISADIEKKILGREAIINKYYNEITKHPYIASWHYRRLGSLYSLINNTQMAKIFFRKSLRYDKFNFGSWLHLLLQTVYSPTDRWFIEKFGINTIKGIKIIS